MTDSTVRADTSTGVGSGGGEGSVGTVDVSQTVGVDGVADGSESTTEKRRFSGSFRC